MLKNECLWYDEDIERNKRRSRFDTVRSYAKDVLSSLPVQIVISLVIIADLAMSLIGIIEQVRSQNESSTNKQLVQVILVVLTIEVLLRIFADGFAFFKNWLNKTELVFITCGLALALTESKFPGSAGRVLRPIVRGMRASRVGFNMFHRGRKLQVSLDQKISDKVYEVAKTFADDFVKLPKDNISVQALSGTFQVEKARLATEAFQNLHLPFQLRGGFVEHVYVELPVKKSNNPKPPKYGGKSKGNPEHEKISKGSALKVTVRNALVVIGYGSTISWDDADFVRNRKEELIKLIVKHIIPKGLPEVKPRTNPRHGTMDGGKTNGLRQPRSSKNIVKVILTIRRRLRKYSQSLKKWLGDMVYVRLLSGLDIQVQNIVIQFEDGIANEHRAVAAGMKLGSLRISTTQSTDPVVRHHNSVHQFFEAEKHVTTVPHDFEIAIDRFSLFWSSRPSSFYAEKLQSLQTPLALKQLIMSDILERVRLALAKRLDKRVSLNDPCAKKDGPLKFLFQQMTYILLPLKVHFKCPLTDMTRAPIDISLTPTRIELDNRQADSLNFVISNFRRWLLMNRMLQLQPEARISSILHRDPSLPEVTEYERHTIIRQWWLHAFRGVQEMIGAQTRHVLCLVELQMRSARRLEYIEVLTQLHSMDYVFKKFSRSKITSLLLSNSDSRSNPLVTKMLDKLFGGTLTSYEGAVSRKKALQLRMALLDVIPCHFESRFVAAEKMADQEAQAKKLSRFGSKSAVEPANSDSDSDISDDDVRTPNNTGASSENKATNTARNSSNTTHVHHNRSGSTGFEGDLEAPAETIGPKEKKKGNTNNGVQLTKIAESHSHSSSEVGYRQEFQELKDSFLELANSNSVPHQLVINIPVVEAAFVVFNTWEDTFQQVKAGRPRARCPVRQRLMRGWLCGARVMLQITPHEGVFEVLANDLGSCYGEPRTGVEATAVTCNLFAYNRTKVALVWRVSRAIDNPNAPIDKTTPWHNSLSDLKEVIEAAEELPANTWKGSLSIGRLDVIVDTVRLKRIDKYLTATHMFLDRFVSWLLARPQWMGLRLTRPPETSPLSELALDRIEAEQEVRLGVRSFELSTLLGRKFGITWQLEVTFRGCHARILRPAWTDHRWVLHHGGRERVVDLDVFVPRCRKRILQTVDPAGVHVELLEFPENEDIEAPCVSKNDPWLTGRMSSVFSGGGSVTVRSGWITTL